MPMTLSLQQKPPVIFFTYSPESVIDREHIFTKSSVVSTREKLFSCCWRDYGISLLASVDPCMEANDGIAAIASRLAERKNVSGLAITWRSHCLCELRLAERQLFLSETSAGETYLYFFNPYFWNIPDIPSRLELSDYGTETAVSFIETLFKSGDSVSHYIDKYLG